MNSFIYIRTSESYDAFNACKLGKTTSIPDRDAQYATGEIKRGVFAAVYEVARENLAVIERLLQREFKQYQIYHNAGIEFYDKIILLLIEPYFEKIDIVYNKLTEIQINDLTRINRIRNTNDLLSDEELLIALNSLKTNRYAPRKYQEKIIKKAIEHFQTHDKGILVLMCGVGKTLISLWITQNLDLKTILVGVPTMLPLYQWKSVINQVFPQKRCLIVSFDVQVSEIQKFLSTNKDDCIVISTYASAAKIASAVSKITFTFGMKINDEAHHLTTTNMEKSSEKAYIHMLEIPCSKQISLTATLKELEDYNQNTIANNNIEYFGEIITTKSLLWSINKSIVCDYVIQTITTNMEDFDKNTKGLFTIQETDKRLFLAALKSISNGDSHHLLIYANNLKNSKKIIDYMKQLLQKKYFTLPDLFYENYNGALAPANQEAIIKDFSSSRFGIISCVYCLGEGWDFPLLDGVVFAENMSSNIRIVQSALRASRKSQSDPHKIAKIILPVFLDTESDLDKIKQVIYQIGLEDESIIQKIKISKISLTFPIL